MSKQFKREFRNRMLTAEEAARDQELRAKVMAEFPKMTHLDLNPPQIDVLSELYDKANCTLDDLPYSDEFEQLWSDFVARTGLTLERRYLWKALCNARKAGRLARKER